MNVPTNLPAPNLLVLAPSARFPPITTPNHVLRSFSISLYPDKEILLRTVSQSDDFKAGDYSPRRRNLTICVGTRGLVDEVAFDHEGGCVSVYPAIRLTCFTILCDW